MLFDRSSPPPFYQAKLSAQKRMALDCLFIGQRSQAYYLKRFASFDQAERIGARWHWAAFVMTLPWLLYRRRFLDGLVYAVVGWSFVHLIITLVLVVNETVVLPFLPATLHWPSRLVIVGLMWLLWSALTAMWADAYYYRVARREISETLEDRLPPHEQAVWLQREGGTSWQGLALSCTLFAGVLFTIQSLYLPMYATYVRRNLLLEAYDATAQAQQRVAAIYSQTGVCPVDLSLSTQDQLDQLGHIRVQQRAEGVPSASLCVVQLTIERAAWPIQSTNGEQLTFYALPNQDAWRCMSSIGRRDTPKDCQMDTP